MSGVTSTNLPSIAEELVDFRRQFESLILATVAEDGSPHASYAPFVRDPEHGAYYVYVSTLARHTAHLARGQAELLLIEDQHASPNPFARRRLSYQCDVELVVPGPERDRVMLDFSRRFGNIVATLRHLPDFRLFRLSPRNGVYVKGFGQAFRLLGADLSAISPIGPERGEGSGAGL